MIHRSRSKWAVANICSQRRVRSDVCLQVSSDAFDRR